MMISRIQIQEAGLNSQMVHQVLLRKSGTGETEFGFVRYSTHGEVALAIRMGNTQPFLCGRQIKCLWGNKPTPPGTSSNPLPLPAPGPMNLTADLMAYERQLAMSKIGGMQAMMAASQAQHHPLKHAAAMGMSSAGASQAIYDGGFQNVMYYQ